VHKDIEKILIPSQDVKKRVKELAAQISADYSGKTPTLVGVLKGCAVFMSDLAQQLSIDVRMDFMMLSSYSGVKSTGVVRTILDLKDSIQGRDVLIVEDIIDSGLTMSYLLKNLKTRGPKSLTVCTFLDKYQARTAAVPIKYTGFRIQNEFVVGYGLDYNELYRNLPYIGVLKTSAVKGNGEK